MKNKFLSARLNPDTEYQAQFLMEVLHLGKTSLIETAISYLYKETQKRCRKKTPFALMDECHLIGALEAEADLSENYKAKITQSLEKKFGQ
jgi:hypothetical protein